MPFLKIETNVSIQSEDELDMFLKAASKLVSNMLGKPEQYIMLSYLHNPDMLFNGQNSALAYVELKSIGLDDTKTAAYSAAICGFLTEKLAIPADRTYIEFADAARHLWGWNNKTF